MKLDNQDYAFNLYCKGLDFAKSGFFEKAIAAFDEAIANVPEGKYKEALFDKGAVLLLMNRYEEALASFDYIITHITADLPMVYYSKGIVLMKMDRDEDAIISFDQAIALTPESYNGEYWRNKGIALMNLFRFEEAITAFDQAIIHEIDGKKFPAFCNRGAIFSFINNHEEAINSFNQAIADSPDRKYPEASYNKGIDFFKLELYEQAINAYNQAVADATDKYPPASYNKGIVLIETQKYEEAICAFDEAISNSFEGNFSLAWMMKAMAYLLLSKKELAKVAIYASIKQCNDNVHAFSFLVENFSSHTAYKNRIKFLDILFLRNSKKIVVESSLELESVFGNFIYEDNVSLYCTLLLESQDILKTGYTFYERLRISYLIFATHDRPYWVYYIIKYLIEDGQFSLTAFDYYFYLNSAVQVAVGYNELIDLVEKSKFENIFFNRIDNYLYQLKEPMKFDDLHIHLNNDLERKIYLQFYLQNNPYIVDILRNQLELEYLTINFPPVDYIEHDKNIFLLNISDNLEKDNVNIEQLGFNIGLFINSSSVSNLGIILKKLTEANIDLKIDDYYCNLLKAFAITKFLAFYIESLGKVNASVLFFARIMISTVIGKLFGLVIPATILYAFVYNCLYDVCSEEIKKMGRLNSNFSWEDFNKLLTNKKDWKKHFSLS